MKKVVRALTFEALSLGQAFPTTKTARERVERLIEHLRPMSTATPLIRLGPAGDGGYLVPDDLAAIEACFSPGVADLSDFELECANRGMKVFMADGSVDGPAQSHPSFHFDKRFIGAVTNETFMTIDRWVGYTGVSRESDLLLQIDIEGHEYAALLATSDALMKRFRVIVGEFHLLNQLWNEPFFALASSTFEKILQTHTCVHVHPNNDMDVFDRWGLAIPPLLEITFLRKDRVIDARPAQTFPHPLDADCTPRAHLPLPARWYAGGVLL
ncbi:MAG: FkbM family methyltransferase [Rubrivivax sp.]|nr:FkbM family methyltransferase [Rubrivivax sp.]